MRQLGFSHLRKGTGDSSKGQTKVLHTLKIEGQQHFSAYDFFIKKNQSDNLHISASFEHILKKNMQTFSRSWHTLQYCDDTKKDGKDHKLFKELKIMPQPAIHMLCCIAYILSSDYLIKKNLLVSGTKKIATNIFYAKNSDGSLSVIGLRWNKIKKNWCLFGWELGERDKHSDIIRIFF